MNASTWNQVVISDETEELVKASLAPSTVETYRLAMQQLEKWLDGRVLNDNLLATYITGLYQDGKSPATISKIVAAVKWTTKNQGIKRSPLRSRKRHSPAFGVKVRAEDEDRWMA